MNIFEAAKAAQEQGVGISRALYWKAGLCIVPTNSLRGCMLVSYNKGSRTAFRWQPKLEDLLAEDWQVEGEAIGMLRGRNKEDMPLEPEGNPENIDPTEGGVNQEGKPDLDNAADPEKKKPGKKAAVDCAGDAK